MNRTDASCDATGCADFRFDLDAALREGWTEVEEALYCPLHGSVYAYVAKKAAQRAGIDAQISARRRYKDNQVALKYLSAADYRAWDEFQSDMANFHRKHRKLAPKVLRTMRPMEWKQEYAQKGRIDIEATAEYFEHAEEQRQARIAERLRGV